MAHVRGEAGLALDPVLQVGRHPVEGRRQLLEVDVVARVDPGVELAAGDRDGRIGDVGEGAKCPAARPPPEGGAGQRRHQRCAGQGVRQVTQGAGELGEREDLEVRGTRCGERHADHQLRCVGEDEELRRRRARQDTAAFGLRDRVLTDRDRGRVPLSAGVEHRQRAGQRVDRADQLADLGPRRAQRALEERGVGERLPLHRGLPVAEQGLASGEVGDARHQGRQDERPDGERRGDPRPQTEPAGEPGAPRAWRITRGARGAGRLRVRANGGLLFAGQGQTASL